MFQVIDSYITPLYLSTSPVVIAAQDNTHYILSDIVHITFHSGNYKCSSICAFLQNVPFDDNYQLYLCNEFIIIYFILKTKFNFIHL